MRNDDYVANQMSESEIHMVAAEAAICTVFEEADDDTMYHHDVNNFRNATLSEKVRADSSDVAESILGWTIKL